MRRRLRRLVPWLDGKLVGPLRHWKLILFSLLAVGALFVGVAFASVAGLAATPPEAGRADRPAIRMLTDSPDATVSITAQIISPAVLATDPRLRSEARTIVSGVGGDPDTDSAVVISAAVRTPPGSPPAHWLICVTGPLTGALRAATGTHELFPGVHGAVVPAYTDGAGASAPRGTALVITGSSAALPGGPTSGEGIVPIPVGEVVIGTVPVLRIDDANVAGYSAVLPVIGFNSAEPDSPRAFLTSDAASGALGAVTLPDASGEVTAPPPGPGKDVTGFGNPRSFSATESIWNGAAALIGSRIDTVLPPSVAVENNSLEWTTHNILAPEIDTSRKAVADSKGTYDFYAGLAFATAAAAAVAALQELPPGRAARRRRDLTPVHPRVRDPVRRARPVRRRTTGAATRRRPGVAALRRLTTGRRGPPH